MVPQHQQRTAGFNMSPDGLQLRLGPAVRRINNDERMNIPQGFGRQLRADPAGRSIRAQVVQQRTKHARFESPIAAMHRTFPIQESTVKSVVVAGAPALRGQTDKPNDPKPRITAGKISAPGRKVLRGRQHCGDRIVMRNNQTSTSNPA